MSEPIALYYDDSGYVETLDRPAAVRAEQPAGLMGRQVAGKEFLDAYLTHGRWSHLVALASNQVSVESLKRTCFTHPSARERPRRLQWFLLQNFVDAFAGTEEPPSRLIYFPTPPDPRFAWARYDTGRHPFALCGVTHTLCSATAVDVLREMVTAPFEPYDRLICTSQAVVDMVKAVGDAYADYLAERWGTRPERRIGLELLPLGVNTRRFRPASPGERAAERSRLGIGDDELVVLFVGRLSHHAKAHPFPMLRSLGLAAARTGCRVRLLLSGWAASPTILDAFRESAAEAAGPVRCTFLDGTAAENRFQVWHAADVFTSLSDNVQETFGLVIIEAMACGLPVVASDWNGYRDLVVAGESGFLVPTAMVQGATSGLTTRLIVGETNYDHFLARASQNTVVDVAAATEAFCRLLEDVALRRRMGQAGRRRAEERFAWQHVIGAYERLWDDQQAQLREAAAAPARTARRQAAYPALETSFRGYPTAWLDEQHSVMATSDARERLPRVSALRLTGHGAESRASSAALLAEMLARAEGGCRIGDLVELSASRGVAPPLALASVAWLLKYDLLARSESG